MYKKLKIDSSNKYIKRLSIENIKDNASIVIIGKRGFGKTEDCIDLINKKFSDKKGHVINQSLCDNYIYKEKLKNCILKIGFDKSQLLYQLFDNTKYLVCDNCFTLKSHNILREIFTNNNKFRIVTMQFPYHVDVEIGKKIDYIFIHQDNFCTSKKKIYDMYIHNKNFIKDFRTFSKLMDSLAIDFNCMVIDNTSTSNKIEDRIYWYNSHADLNMKIINQIIEKANSMCSSESNSENEDNICQDWDDLDNNKPNYNIVENYNGNSCNSKQNIVNEKEEKEEKEEEKEEKEEKENNENSYTYCTLL